MSTTMKTWLLGLITAVLLAVLQAAIAYLTSNPPDALSVAASGGVGFVAGRLAALRVV